MDQINAVWPKWHTVELIGRGAFGEVYKAKREELGETFYSAVKVIQIPRDEQEVKEMMEEGHTSQSIRYYYESIARGLMNEIRVLEILKSAGNIVNIEEFEIQERAGGVGWDAYIRMELLSNLNEYRRDYPMDAGTVARLGMDICRALVYCEKSQIIHRDIKPSNIFIDGYGNFKLGDFGIARQMEKTQSTLSQKGTELYMAPEVRFGLGKGSYNVDIYSLGLVMYRLLNRNKMPFEPLDVELVSYQDKEEALARRLRGEALPLPKEAPLPLGQIILKACQAEKEARYQSASQMYEELEQWTRGQAMRQEDPIQEQQKRQEQQEDPRGEETIIGFGSVNRRQPHEEKREEKAPEPVRGEDFHISQYVDAQTAKKGGTVRVTGSNGKPLHVTIPAGWQEGQKLRLKGLGKAGKFGGPAGDLYVEVKILKNSGTRKGRKYIGAMFAILLFYEFVMLMTGMDGYFLINVRNYFTYFFIWEVGMADALYSLISGLGIIPAVVLCGLYLVKGRGKEQLLSAAVAVAGIVFFYINMMDAYIMYMMDADGVTTARTSKIVLLLIGILVIIWICYTDSYLQSRMEREKPFGRKIKRQHVLGAGIGWCVLSLLLVFWNAMSLSNAGALFPEETGEAVLGFFLTLLMLGIMLVSLVKRTDRFDRILRVCCWAQCECMIVILYMQTGYRHAQISGVTLGVAVLYAAALEFFLWYLPEEKKAQ